MNNEQKIAAMVEWLEANQPDVFRRGLWEAIGATPVEQSPVASPVAGWVSVEERLPEDDQEVFVLYWPYNNKENKQIIGGAKYWDGSFYTHDGDEHHPPSHWYPAPPAPVVTPTQQEQSNG